MVSTSCFLSAKMRTGGGVFFRQSAARAQSGMLTWLGFSSFLRDLKTIKINFENLKNAH